MSIFVIIQVREKICFLRSERAIQASPTQRVGLITNPNFALKGQDTIVKSG
jgi:hypothetical protein